MAQTIIKNTKGLKIQTPTGMKNFSGMSKTWHKRTVEISSATRKITCGLKHKFLVDPGWVDAEHLEPGMSLTTLDGKDDPILGVTIKDDPQWMFDLLDVEGGSAYVTEGIISHNCEFISSEAMLIDSLKLSYLKPMKPVTQNMGFKFWVPTEQLGGRGKTYLVGLDPGTGNGKDFTVIEVVEFPKMEQVAELRLNTVNIPLIYAKLKWLFKFLRKPGPMGGRAEIIWSFERNGVGEALVAMIQNDDSPDGGVYIDGVDLYNENPQRLGCYTTGKSKLLSCMQLKNLIEKGPTGIKINSDTMLYELQNFVAMAGSYQAKQGCTDDCIMALALVMKTLSRLASYDDKARTVVYESVDPDSDDRDADLPPDQYGNDPVPIFI